MGSGLWLRSQTPRFTDSLHKADWIRVGLGYRNCYMNRSILKNPKSFRLLPCLAGFTFLAAMLPMTSSHAQPVAPGSAAGTEIPAWVRTEIDKLQSTNTPERNKAILRLRHREAAAAIPVLIQLLGNGEEYPRTALMVLSTVPLTRSCSPECTVGGEAAETLARIGQIPDGLMALLKSGNPRQVASPNFRAIRQRGRACAIEPEAHALLDQVAMIQMLREAEHTIQKIPAHLDRRFTHAPTSWTSREQKSVH